MTDKDGKDLAGAGPTGSQQTGAPQTGALQTGSPFAGGGQPGASRSGGPLSSVSAPLTRPPRRLARMTLAFVILAVGGALAWAHFTKLEEFTAGNGRVIPASKVKLVQNLEGGIVKEILVRDGQTVRKGQVIFRIDQTGTGSNYKERLERLAGMRAMAVRLRAEVNGEAPIFPAELKKSHPEFVKRELHLYTTRQRAEAAGIRVLIEQVGQRARDVEQAESRKKFAGELLKKVRQEIDFTKPLVKQGLTSKVDFLKLEVREIELRREIDSQTLLARKGRQAQTEAKQRLNEKKSAFRADALKELNKVEVEMAALRESIKLFRDRVDRADVRSPVNGVVKTVKVTTVGQVVTPGMDLAEIVPVDDSLLVEADIKPSDVAFLYPGQKATVKITAYEYTTYGSLEGKLESIGADTITDKNGNAFYRVTVRTNRNHLVEGGKKLPIIPGMVARVDVLTGKKTILSYLLKPINRIRSNALREK